jgi:predicted enzyme related to lactoylglutathione lyase
VPPLRDDEPAAVQDPERLLNGALGQARLLGDLAVAHALPLPAPSVRPPPEEEIDDERGRAVVVSDEIAQEDVDDVLVERESRHEATIPFTTIATRERLYRAEAVCHKSGRRKETMLKRIKFTTVPVQDQARALEFYSKKLGLRVFTDQAMGDSRWIELQVPGADTLLVLYKRGQHPEEPPAIVFEADNVKATYEELKSRGIEFVEPPKKAPWGEHAIFKDSEGNLVLFGTA